MNRLNAKSNEFASDFITRIKTGVIKKDNLSNNGRRFTGGPEKNALHSFSTYIGSYSYALMQKRVSGEERYYGW